MNEFDKYLNKNFETGLGEPSIYILRHTFEAGAQSKQAEIDELKSRLKAINEYQEIIYIELQEDKPNRYLMFNKLEDICDLSKGTTNEQ